MVIADRAKQGEEDGGEEEARRGDREEEEAWEEEEIESGRQGDDPFATTTGEKRI